MILYDDFEKVDIRVGQIVSETGNVVLLSPSKHAKIRGKMFSRIDIVRAKR